MSLQFLLSPWLPSHCEPITALAAVFGLMLGSFLNVVGLRLLCQQSVVFPGSHCPNCEKPLQCWENIPLISYLLLRGKCSGCRAGIHWQYPAIELLSGALFALLVWQWGVSLSTVLLGYLLSNLVVVLITDCRQSLIYHMNTLPLIPSGLLFASLNSLIAYSTFPGHGFIDALLGIALAAAIFEGLILLTRLMVGSDGFGHGDTLLMMGVGAFFGWKFTLAAIFLGFVLQSLAALPLMITSWIQARRYLLMASGLAALTFAALPLLLPILSLPNSLTVSLGCCVLSLLMLVVFMREIRQAACYTSLPLGPALVAATLVLVFGRFALMKWLPQLALL
ncbi:MAG: prepilin peptidase [Vampirovibrionales bacterium]|nr:prepilin peptidase [Vampirovibrionales bacterium]